MSNLFSLQRKALFHLTPLGSLKTLTLNSKNLRQAKTIKDNGATVSTLKKTSKTNQLAEEGPNQVTIKTL